jgi:aarF domain-containing kinase
VVLDHGLYIEEGELFRKQYAALWTSLLMLDSDATDRICREWGISDTDMFISFQIFKPFQRERPVHLERASVNDIARMQTESKERVQKMLKVREEREWRKEKKKRESKRG